MKSSVPFLSLRYLWFHKVSSGLGILGVTLGVGLILVVTGVMDGFQARLRRSLIGSTAAVVVYPRYEVDAEALVRELKARVPGVVEASPIVKQPTLITTERGGERHSQPCQVVGIDPARERAVGDLERRLRRKHGPGYNLVPSASVEEPFRASERERYLDRKVRPEKKGVILGRGLAAELRLGDQSRVRLFTLKPRDGGGGPNGGRERDFRVESEEFVVTGFYDADDSEVDKVVVLMDRRDALSFFGDGTRPEADEVRLLLESPERADEVRDAVDAVEADLWKATLKEGGRSALDYLDAVTWKDIHRTILLAVDSERGLLLVISSFSFIVVAFLIGSTQSMLVVEKTREIGVLRALGGSVAGTAGVFLGNGFFIGTLGSLAGWGLGTAVTSNIESIRSFLWEAFGHDPFPRDIYRFDEIPVEVKGGFVLAVCVGAVVFALLGSLLPALRAALLDPVESLHHE